MNRHLPSISGRELIRALQRAGFVLLRQKGSHVSLERRTPEGYWRMMVPLPGLVIAAGRFQNSSSSFGRPKARPITSILFKQCRLIPFPMPRNPLDP